MTRSLPIKNPDGTWIKRPGLYVLARMAYEDKWPDSDVRKLYETMLQSKPEDPKRGPLEQLVIKELLPDSLRIRLFAGHAVVQMIRIAATTGLRPSQDQAAELVAFHQRRHESNRSQIDGLKRRVREGLSKYRNTLHLQTAMSMINKSIAPIEDDMAAFLEFLTWALAIEVFLDAEVMNQSFKWDPWRVPLDPQAAFGARGWSFPIEIQKLNSEELRLIERG